MRVYVVRHGESLHNVKGLWTGWADVPLTEKGREDAARAGAILRAVPFDKVYASDLSRALETAAVALPDYSPEASPLLREIDVGSLASTPIFSLSDEQRARCLDEGYVQFGGEARQDFLQRQQDFLRILESTPYENIAIFTHAGWLCGMLSAVLECAVSRRHLVCGNCAIGVFEYKDNNWKLHSWINA